MYVKLLIYIIFFDFVQFFDEILFFCFLDNCLFVGYFCLWINDNSDDFDWLLNSGEIMIQEIGFLIDVDGDGKEKEDCFFMKMRLVQEKY